MTLVLALKWVSGEGKESVVVSSDSKATIGPVSYETRKIYPIAIKSNERIVPLAVAAGAGDALLIKQGYRMCEKILTETAIKEWGERTPSFDQFEDGVRHIESVLIKRFKELHDHGIESSFNMILASVDASGRASIYLFDDRGLAEPMHDNPGFAVIGTGFITGGNMLLRLLGYNPSESYLMDLGALTAFIIDVVSEIDPAVGPFVGESYLMRVENGEVVLGPLTEKALSEYKEKVRLRRGIIRRIWRILDAFGDERFIRKIEEIEKEIEEKTENER